MSTHQVYQGVYECGLQYYIWTCEYERIPKSYRTESITKWTTTINTHWEATKRITAVKLTRLTHKIAIQLHLVAESCIIYISHSRVPVRKLLATPSYAYPLFTSFKQCSVLGRLKYGGLRLKLKLTPYSFLGNVCNFSPLFQDYTIFIEPW
jgi:hypothetical protein